MITLLLIQLLSQSQVLTAEKLTAGMKSLLEGVMLFELAVELFYICIKKDN